MPDVILKSTSAKPPGFVKLKTDMLVIPVLPVGAANPYALASALAVQQTGKAVNWKKAEKKNLVHETLVKYLGDYDNFFDPVDCPVLYPGLTPVPPAIIMTVPQKWTKAKFRIPHSPYPEEIIRKASKKPRKSGNRILEGQEIVLYSD